MRPMRSCRAAPQPSPAISDACVAWQAMDDMQKRCRGACSKRNTMRTRAICSSTRGFTRHKCTIKAIKCCVSSVRFVGAVRSLKKTLLPPGAHPFMVLHRHRQASTHNRQASTHNIDTHKFQTSVRILLMVFPTVWKSCSLCRRLCSPGTPWCSLALTTRL